MIKTDRCISCKRRGQIMCGPKKIHCSTCYDVAEMRKETTRRLGYSRIGNTLKPKKRS